MIYVVCLVAVFIGPVCFYLGLKIGMDSQFRAQRGIKPTGILERSGRVEVHGETPPEPKNAEQMADMKQELAKLDNIALKDRCEFYNLPFDDRKSARESVISAVVNAHFNPGVYRA